ncbi:MAG: hypothetical protein DRN25_04480 [Thermoplasmata archaeon]|nr:MAG: hypothetical protein DRN25_04480 [Thermoplasmata archaeon]
MRGGFIVQKVKGKDAKKGKNKLRGIFYSILYFFVGSSVLCFFATLQKIYIGAPLVLRGYLVPFLFGGACGFLLGIWRMRLQEYMNIWRSWKGVKKRV